LHWRGCAQDKGITELLLAPGQLADQIAGMSGTRNLSDNLSDLKAQVCNVSVVCCCDRRWCALRLLGRMIATA